MIVGSLSYATKFIYKFLLPVRLIAQAFVAAGERIVSVFMNLPLVSTLRNLFATVRSFFSGDMTFFEAGKKMLVTLGEGIWSAVTYPFRMLKNALGKLRSLLPFSDAKEGPLSTLTASGKALLKTLADGMLSTLALPAKVFSFVARRVLSALSGVWNGIKTAGQTAMNLISAAENPGNVALAK